MKHTTSRPAEPTQHFDIKLEDGSFFPAVEGADELDAAETLGAILGLDVSHFVHDAIPVDPDPVLASTERQ